MTGPELIKAMDGMMRNKEDLKKQVNRLARPKGSDDNGKIVLDNAKIFQSMRLLSLLFRSRSKLRFRTSQPRILKRLSWLSGRQIWIASRVGMASPQRFLKSGFPCTLRKVLIGIKSFLENITRLR